MEDPVELWSAEFYAGAGTRLKDALRNSRELLDPAVADVLEGALEATVADYYEKVFARYELREKVRRFFESYDLLLTPTLPVPPFGAGVNVPPELPDRNIVSWVYYTYPFNLTGNPAASIPSGLHRRRPARGPADGYGNEPRDGPAAPGRGLRVGAPWANSFPNRGSQGRPVRCCDGTSSKKGERGWPPNVDA